MARALAYAAILGALWAAYEIGNTFGGGDVRRTTIVSRHPYGESFGPYHGRCYDDPDQRVQYCAHTLK